MANSFAVLLVVLLTTASLSAQAPVPAAVKNLPLIELPVDSALPFLGVFLSGDGGWAELDRQVGRGMERFLQGVHRVLRPSGYLLYADHRPAAPVHILRREFQEAGLSILEEECINANVLKALESDDARKQALIQAKVPRVLHPFF